jgi:hypothetical protein
MMQESAFIRMCKVLAVAFLLAAIGFLYPLCICGAHSLGYSLGLSVALFVFMMTVSAGVVLYLE